MQPCLKTLNGKFQKQIMNFKLLSMMNNERTGIGSGPQDQVLRPNSQHKGDLFAPEGRGWNKEQRQEIEEEGDGEGNKGKGAGVFVPEDKGLTASG